MIGGHEGVQVGGVGVFRQGHAGAVDEITEQGDNGHQVFGGCGAVDWEAVDCEGFDWKGGD